MAAYDNSLPAPFKHKPLSAKISVPTTTASCTTKITNNIDLLIANSNNQFIPTDENKASYLNFINTIYGSNNDFCTISENDVSVFMYNLYVDSLPKNIIKKRLNNLQNLFSLMVQK